MALQNAKRAAGETASNVITVSVNEKPGVQAIGNTAPDLPPVPGKIPKSAAIMNARDSAPAPYWQRSTFRMVRSRHAWRTAIAASNSLAY